VAASETANDQRRATSRRRSTTSARSPCVGDPPTSRPHTVWRLALHQPRGGRAQDARVAAPNAVAAGVRRGTTASLCHPLLSPCPCSAPPVRVAFPVRSIPFPGGPTQLHARWGPCVPCPPCVGAGGRAPLLGFARGCRPSRSAARDLAPPGRPSPACCAYVDGRSPPSSTARPRRLVVVTSGSVAARCRYLSPPPPLRARVGRFVTNRRCHPPPTPPPPLKC